MGYFLSFGLLYLGYCLVDWGHYTAKHDPVSLWWLMSGQGLKYPTGTGIPNKQVQPNFGNLNNSQQAIAAQASQAGIAAGKLGGVTYTQPTTSAVSAPGRSGGTQIV